MPEIDSHRMTNRFYPAQILSFVYGNKLIEDNSPSDYPNTDTAVREFSPVIFLKMVRYGNSAFVNQEESDTSIIDLPENQDPITQATLLKREEDQVQELIFRIKRSRTISCQELLANRLLTLFYDAKEEDPDCVGIAAESLRNYYNFIHLHTNIKCPTISLTPEYNIYASWRDEQNRVLSVHFLPNMDVRFVMFKPNDRHPERKIRVSGIATIDILMDTLTPYCIEDWILE